VIIMPAAQTDLSSSDPEIAKGSVFLCKVAGDMVTRSLVKWFAGLTIFFGLPLYFAKFIRETWFAEGFPFVLIYSWGLVAVLALPVFMLAQLRRRDS
jgi:hypothetical protein